MKHCISAQCLSVKLPDWQPEPDDEDFEKDAKYCFLTGISVGGVYEWEVEGLTPTRHGVSRAEIDNNSWDDV